MLFWRVVFPFHAKYYTELGRVKYIHVLCIFLGLLIPLISIVASIAKSAIDARREAGNGTSAVDLLLSDGLGFSNLRYPPIFCSPRDQNVAFYFLIIPLDLIQAVGTTLIIAIIWRIRRVSTLIL